MPYSGGGWSYLPNSNPIKYSEYLKYTIKRYKKFNGQKKYVFISPSEVDLLKYC